MDIADVRFFSDHGYFAYPMILQIEVTNACPLKCPQCYKEIETSYLNYELFCNIVDEAKRIGVTFVNLNGGEPFCHKDIYKMIDYLCHKNMQIGIVTSGINVDLSKLVTIRNIEQLRLLISLNGSTQEINSQSRDGYQFAIGLLAKLRKHSVKLDYGINWVARHDNIDDLFEIKKLAKYYECSHINIVANKTSNIGIVSGSLARMDYDRLKQIILEDVEYYNIQQCYGVLNSYVFPNRTGRLYGCQAGICLCCVDVHGKYMPCTHIIKKEQFNSIIDYWKNSEILGQLRFLQYNSETKCGMCRKKGSCRFCHAMSFKTANDLSLDYQDCCLFEE